MMRTSICLSSERRCSIQCVEQNDCEQPSQLEAAGCRQGSPMEHNRRLEGDDVISLRKVKLTRRLSTNETRRSIEIEETESQRVMTISLRLKNHHYLISHVASLSVTSQDLSSAWKVGLSDLPLFFHFVSHSLNEVILICFELLSIEHTFSLEDLRQHDGAQAIKICCPSSRTPFGMESIESMHSTNETSRRHMRVCARLCDEITLPSICS